MIRGTFHAISTRDATARERDGHAFHAVKRLGNDGRGEPLYEVLFEDGLWMLTVAADLIPSFGLDAWPGKTWRAERYGQAWNGWATPVVTRETLEDLLLAIEKPHIWDGDAVTVSDDEVPLQPHPDGLYDLHFLGWCFEQISLEEPPPAASPDLRVVR